MNNEAYMKVFEVLGMAGHMLSGSKSGYSHSHPNNVAVFNANLIVEGLGKVWFGDIDVTRQADKLQALADEFGAKVYVLREMDGRFKYEDNPRIENAVCVFEPSAERVHSTNTKCDASDAAPSSTN